jgi:2-polyprenyl-6-methoxyphenol hydroxylase-like FAD-dependent oxidoreductase
MHTSELQTEVAIVGGGPAGLMLAIELGCRGIGCVVLDDRPDGPIPPKANATSARTMEHYRRRGFAHRIRAVGLTDDHPQDVVFRTRLAMAPGHHEVARIRQPSRRDVLTGEGRGDYREEMWPTPELPHRGQQMYIEPILREEARRYPSVRVLQHHRAVSLAQDMTQGQVFGVDLSDSSQFVVRAGYVVGCDGARSLVRQTLGIPLQGIGREEREFFGGQMLSVYLRSSSMYQALGPDRAWLYWAVNPQLRGLICAVNGVDEFLFGMQLRDGQSAADVDVLGALHTVLGQPVDVEIISSSPWLAGYTLVAERMRSGRLLIAGDAAHLFTPTTGMGYNTSIDDAVNLGWKLAASLRGWGGPGLLDSYDAERRPVAHRNTAFAREMADSLGRGHVSAAVEADGPEGDAAREVLRRHFQDHVHREFNIPGIQLGVSYRGSAIVARETASPPPDDPNVYHPSGHPGGRAPHIVAADGSSILDHFGQDFTLLNLGGEADDGDAWARSAAALGLPLTCLRWTDAAARSVYGADLVLIRPDNHVAWRGAFGADADAVLRASTGWSVVAPMR